MKFATIMDIVKHLSKSQNDWMFLRYKIIEEQSRDPAILEWRQKRTLFARTPHFRKYWTSRSDIYGKAARAIHAGVATPHQADLVASLVDEINSSQVTIDPGQILFHSRRDTDLSTIQPFPSFVSTAPNPVTFAFNAASVIKAGKAEICPGYFYVLTARRTMQALWGETKDANNYQLLLPPGLTVNATASTPSELFTIIDATIG
jgi:hypothetical protein